MTLREYWETLRHSWLLITATTLLGLGAALGMSMAATPVYQAEARLFVSVRSGEEVYSAYSGGLFVEQRMDSYVDLVGTPGVLNRVIEDMDLDTTAPALAGAVSAVSSPNTVLLGVTAADTDPAMAQRLANATARSLARQIGQLEETDSGIKPVKAQMVRPATVPTAPVSPRTRLNTLLGTFLGFGIGVSLALLRRVSDTSVKRSADLESAAGSTSLGTVLFDPDAKGSPLVTLRDTARGEAFRSIRTNLRYVDVDNPPKTVVITSSLPGEGKTTAACNVAIALAQAGSRVLLIEADLRRPKASEYLGVAGGVGLTDILIGQASAEAAVTSWHRGLLDFLPSGAIPPNPSELLGSKQMADLLDDFAERYDAVIIDAPPLLPVTDAAILATAADGAILVTRYGKTSRDQVSNAADGLRQVGAKVLGTVLNFAPSRKRGSKGYGYGGDYGYGYGYGYGDAKVEKARKRGRLRPEETIVLGDRKVLAEDQVRAPEPRT